MQVLLHFLTLFPKTAFFFLWSLVQRALILFTYKRRPLPVLNDESIELLRARCFDAMPALFAALYEKTFEAGDGRVIRLRDGNSDHQAIRQGSLIWSSGTQEEVNGLSAFFNSNGDFIRGIEESENGLRANIMCAPAAIPISLVFGALAGKMRGCSIGEFLPRFHAAYHKLEARNFWLGDASGELRLASTGFDALYVLALRSFHDFFFVPHDRSKLAHIFSYFPLFFAPITFPFPARRNAYVDHISLIAAWSAYQTERSAFMRWCLRRSMRHIWKLSSAFCNPYYAALLDQCDALTDLERKEVLQAHVEADPIDAAMYPHEASEKILPMDWSNISDEEFIFDRNPDGHAPGKSIATKAVPLNGICLSRSLRCLIALK